MNLRENKTLIWLLSLILAFFIFSDTALAGNRIGGECLAKQSFFATDVGRSEFRAVMICRFIEERMKDGASLMAVLENVILMQRSMGKELEGCVIDASSLYEVRIYIESSGVFVRYFNPNKAQSRILEGEQIGETVCLSESNTGVTRQVFRKKDVRTSDPVNVSEKLDEEFLEDINRFLGYCFGPMSMSRELRPYAFSRLLKKRFEKVDFKEYKNNFERFFKFFMEQCKDEESAKNAVFRLWQMYNKYIKLMDEINRRIQQGLGISDVRFSTMEFLAEGPESPMRNVERLRVSRMKLGLNIEFLFYEEEDNLPDIGIIAHEAGHGLELLINNPTPYAGTEEDSELIANWAASQMLSSKEIERSIRSLINLHKINQNGRIPCQCAAQILAYSTRTGMPDDIIDELSKFCSEGLVSKYLIIWDNLNWMPGVRVEGIKDRLAETADEAPRMVPVGQRIQEELEQYRRRETKVDTAA